MSEILRNIALKRSSLGSQIPSSKNLAPSRQTLALELESDLKKDLQEVASLIANITEAYTAAIFVAVADQAPLILGGVHTLSREFVDAVQIFPGAGLVGWTAANKQRICVSPFEHDATTLLYYSKNQELKSFLAVPILDGEDHLLGVIACDSKKNYAFAKITEKILLDFAKHVAKVITLHAPKPVLRRESSPSAIEKLLEHFRQQSDEKSLLSAACEIPTDIIPRDALVVLTLAENGVGEGVFYSKASEVRVGSRLLEIVCERKKVICSDRSVLSSPVDDAQKRSFLSVPFKVMDREAGSFNLLSHPHQAFQASEVAVLEKVAATVGRELERLRLRELAKAGFNQSLSWSQFSAQAQYRLKEAGRARKDLALLSIKLVNIHQLEATYGLDTVLPAIERIGRLIEQVKGQDAICTRLFGSEFLLLLSADEARKFSRRFKNLLIRMTSTAGELALSQEKMGKSLIEGLVFSSAIFPKDGETISELLARARQTEQDDFADRPTEVAVNAWNWK